MPQKNEKKPVDMSDLGPGGMEDLGREVSADEAYGPEQGKPFSASDIPIGIGKGTLNIGNVPFRLVNYGLSKAFPNTVVDGKTFAEWSKPKAEWQPSNTAQKWSAAVPEFALGMYAGGPMAALDKAVALKTATMPWAARYFLNLGTRATTGAGMGAFEGYASGGNVGRSALLGGVLNTLPAAIFGTGQYAREKARQRIVRALQPSSEIQKDQAIAISDKILDNFEIWASQKGLVKLSTKRLNEFSDEMKDFINNYPGAVDPNGVPQVSLQYLLSRMAINAQREFKPAYDAAGQMTTTNEFGDAGMTVLNEWLEKYLLRAANPPYANAPIEKWTIDLQNLEQIKGSLQDLIAPKGAFMQVSTDRMMAAKDSAYRVAASSLKDTAEALSGDEYTRIMRALHEWTTMKELAKAGRQKWYAKSTPWSEEPTIGMGAPQRPENWLLGIIGGAMRGARQTARSPLWNIFAGQGYNLLSAPTRGTSPQVANPLLSAILPTPEKVAITGAVLGGQPENPVLKRGTIDEGYMYMGGDPSKKESWVKVE